MAKQAGMGSPIGAMAMAMVLAVGAGCAGVAVPAQPPSSVPVPAPVAGVVLPDTEAFTVHDPAGRDYPVWVALPASYASAPQRRYPVLYVTDALYSFPLVRSIRNLVGQGGRNVEDFILVGLPPQQGLSSRQSRSRDYTPTSPVRSADDDYSDDVSYGGAAHYRDFVAERVLPRIDAQYRTDPSRRAFAGHSYGGLFGSYVLLTRPQMFQSYILSSPSLWFDHKVIERIEQDYADGHRSLNARVLLTIGSLETTHPAPPFPQRNDMLLHNQQFAERLRSRGYQGLQVDTGVQEGEDHLTAYPSSITRALLQVFPGSGPYDGG